MSNQASNIQYIPPKCTTCGRQITLFDSMCVSCANKSINNKDNHLSRSAVAVNEQLLEALQRFVGNSTAQVSMPSDCEFAEAAIAAAENYKKGQL